MKETQHKIIQLHNWLKGYDNKMAEEIVKWVKLAKGGSSISRSTPINLQMFSSTKLKNSY